MNWTVVMNWCVGVVFRVFIWAAAHLPHWIRKGCEGCCNYDILQRNQRRMCLCTGMLYDPSKEEPRHSRLKPYAMYLKNAFKKIFHLK